MKNKKVMYIFSIIYLVMFGFKTIVLAEPTSDFDCNDLGAFKTDLQNLFNFLKVILPLLIIGLSSYDFIKAITQKDDKDIKKAFSRLMKRMICAIILFFLPIILNFFLDLVIDSDGVCIN